MTIQMIIGTIEVVTKAMITS